MSKKPYTKVLILCKAKEYFNLKQKVLNYFEKKVIKVIILNEYLNKYPYEKFLYAGLKEGDWVITTNNYITPEEVTRESWYIFRFRRKVLEEKDLVWI